MYKCTKNGTHGPMAWKSYKKNGKHLVFYNSIDSVYYVYTKLISVFEPKVIQMITFYKNLI